MEQFKMGGFGKINLAALAGVTAAGAVAAGAGPLTGADGASKGPLVGGPSKREVVDGH